jgi:hypothetical protein
MGNRMKKCPHCHEDIKFVAIKCRYCRANLVDLETGPKVQQQSPPVVPEKMAQPGWGVVFGSTTAQSPTKHIRERSSRSKLVLVLLAAAFGLFVIAVGILRARDNHEGQGSRGGSDAQASTVGHDAGVVVAMVSIEIRGTPTATITFDGHSAGQTPLKIQIPKSTRPITISAVIAGHRPSTSNIIPDHDQLIELTPPRAPSRRNQQPASGAPPSAGSASIVVATAPAGSASGSGELIDPYETPQPSSPAHATDDTALERPAHNVLGRGSDGLIDPHETHNPYVSEGSAGTAAPPRDPAAAPPAECTDYLAVVKKIVARCDGVPQDVRDGFNDGGKLLFSTFSGPARRKNLIEMCKSSAQSLRRMCHLE